MANLGYCRLVTRTADLKKFVVARWLGVLTWELEGEEAEVPGTEKGMLGLASENSCWKLT